MATTPGARSAPAHRWDGAPFCVRVDARGNPGVAEAGSWRSVPDRLRAIAAAAVREHLPHADFLWRGEVDQPVCSVRIDVRSEAATTVAFISGEPLETLPHDLSRRELEVLTLVTTGASNAEIARWLDISPRTITTHVDNLLRKLDCASRTAAAVRAVDEGIMLVPIPVSRRDELCSTRIGRVLGGIDHGPARLPGTPRVRLRPWRIGAAVPASGPGASDAAEMRRGLQLAIEEINATGGVHGRPVDIEVTDIDIADAASTRAAIEQLADREVDVLTSAYVAHQDVAHDTAAATGIPYLHAATSGAMEERVRNDRGRYSRVLQLCPSDVHYAPRFVGFAGDLHRRGLLPTTSRTLVCIQQTSWQLIDFGTAHAQALADAEGWELVTIDVADENGWTAAAQAAIAREPAAVMIGSYFVDHHIDVVRAVRDARAPSIVYSIYAPSVPAFRERLGAAADGVVWATTTGTYSDAIGLGFAQRFARRFGSAPGRSHAGLAYDRAHVVAQAWARSNDFRDFDDVVRRMRSTTYRGVNGAYSFHPETGVAAGFRGPGDDPSVALAHLVYQIQDGRQEIIAPVPYTTSRFRRPDWLTAPAR
ncbi:ABC transporter substrate-binding protein [Gordonia westfalica]|uniref:Branched-chain amino acid transport system substrate-binding protein n=1 Tax=Gordonia westfalica TaxID=158898 RepID=A0A1H2LGR8_9ACTN|nr:ABC transporter substrate-binding protein [Gordonia westfalica]SDU80217.1 branched-chain amino acid transport system substrate-binding protein [Gordonia westfalica]